MNKGNIYTGKGWVSSTGEYSLGEDILIFDPERLSERQIERLGEFSSCQGAGLEYVKGILLGSPVMCDECGDSVGALRVYVQHGALNDWDIKEYLCGDCAASYGI